MFGTEKIKKVFKNYIIKTLVFVLVYKIGEQTEETEFYVKKEWYLFKLKIIK